MKIEVGQKYVPFHTTTVGTEVEILAVHDQDSDIGVVVYRYVGHNSTTSQLVNYFRKSWKLKVTRKVEWRAPRQGESYAGGVGERDQELVALVDFKAEFKRWVFVD